MKMKPGAWKNLLLFAAGLVLGYYFAVQGGGRYFTGVAGKLPNLTGRVQGFNLSQPAVTLLLIVAVVIIILLTSKRK